MRKRFANLDLILIELGGDNLAATFSPELADLTIYVIDVSGGKKYPRQGGPGITRSDLLVINKIDLAPYVGASLEVMTTDALMMRKGRPFVLANMKRGGRDGSDYRLPQPQGRAQNRRALGVARSQPPRGNQFPAKGSGTLIDAIRSFTL